MDNTVVNRFTLIVGSFLLIEGIWGLFSQTVLFVATSNLVLSALLIATGGAAVWASLKQNAKIACFTLGAVFLATGMLRLFDWSGPTVASLFELNPTGATLDVLIGTAALIVAVGPMRDHDFE